MSQVILSICDRPHGPRRTGIWDRTHGPRRTGPARRRRIFKQRRQGCDKASTSSPCALAMHLKISRSQDLKISSPAAALSSRNLTQNTFCPAPRSSPPAPRPPLLAPRSSPPAPRPPLLAKPPSTCAFSSLAQSFEAEPLRGCTKSASPSAKTLLPPSVTVASSVTLRPSIFLGLTVTSTGVPDGSGWR